MDFLLTPDLKNFSELGNSKEQYLNLAKNWVLEELKSSPQTSKPQSKEKKNPYSLKLEDLNEKFNKSTITKPEDELEVYLKEDTTSRQPCEYWSQNAERFPNLERIARKYLTIMPSRFENNCFLFSFFFLICDFNVSALQ